MKTQIKLITSYDFVYKTSTDNLDVFLESIYDKLEYCYSNVWGDMIHVEYSLNVEDKEEVLAHLRNNPEITSVEEVVRDEILAYNLRELTQELTHEEFWKWVSTWLDVALVGEIISDWDLDTKQLSIEELETIIETRNENV